MIRRGFWLAVGATGGIMGYRRVTSLGRRLTGTATAGRARAKKRRWARETIRFTRDVREGMDLYMSRHPGRAGPTLGASAGADNDVNDVKDDR
jgi:hypothetical protein